MTRVLRHGYTTGACAAAAALGAARMLRDQAVVDSVELWLPAGFAASFTLHGQVFGPESARCFVVKDAGDDPDVTHGVEVWAEVRICPRPTPPPCGHPPCETGGAGGVTIVAGAGIGRVTKPGLAVPPGEPAINPVPRRMITEAVQSVFPPHSSPFTPHVTISIPDGEARARRTLNDRLGIVGGLSILGTTGVVRPISHQAWTDTIEVALDVARAAGCGTVVLSTGRTSELAAQRALTPPSPPCSTGGVPEGRGGGSSPCSTGGVPEGRGGGSSPCSTGGVPEGRGGGGSPCSTGGVPEEAFIMMGDFLGHAVEACARRGFPRIILAAQFAKLVKIAAGHDKTHVRDARLDLAELARWARRSGLDEAEVKNIEWANTARQALEAAPDRGRLAEVAAGEALEQLRRRAPGVAIGILLVGYDGTATRFGEWPETMGGDPGGIG